MIYSHAFGSTNHGSHAVGPTQLYYLSIDVESTGIQVVVVFFFFVAIVLSGEV
jgi:hypothetical protein